MNRDDYEAHEADWGNSERDGTNQLNDRLAIKVHRTVGPGLSEQNCQDCLNSNSRMPVFDLKSE
jgi:hypothetical protein